MELPSLSANCFQLLHHWRGKRGGNEGIKRNNCLRWWITVADVSNWVHTHVEGSKSHQLQFSWLPALPEVCLPIWGLNIPSLLIHAKPELLTETGMVINQQTNSLIVHLFLTKVPSYNFNSLKILLPSLRRVCFGHGIASSIPGPFNF